MARFVFYVIDLEDGIITGSNDPEEIDHLVEDERYILLHQSGSYFQGNREAIEVAPLIADNIEDYTSDPDEDEVG